VVRLVELQLQGFKGIEVTLPWSHLNVLFGPNDSGKTNILEAVALAFGEKAPVRGGASVPSPKFSAVLEFTESGDEQILAALLQRNHVPPIFPAAPSDNTGDGERATPLRPARLRWGARAGRPFVIRPLGPLADDGLGGVFQVPLLSLEETINSLHRRAATSLKRRLRDNGAKWADVELVLSTALGTRRARFEGGVVSLLTPELDEVGGAAVDAAGRLAAAGWREDDTIGPFVGQLADRRPVPAVLLRTSDRREFRPFDVVWSASGESDSELESMLRDEFDKGFFIWLTAAALGRMTLEASEDSGVDLKEFEEFKDFTRAVAAMQRQVSNTSPHDAWLRHVPSDPVAPARWVVKFAEQVSRLANALAAPLVSDAGTLELAVLPPAGWLPDKPRLEPRLLQPHRKRPTPLPELGLGLRAWCAIAALEGATAERRLMVPQFERFGRLSQTMLHVLDPDDAPLVDTQEFGETRRLLIVDEPERHLHPRAQVEISSWLAEGASQKETLIATHAVPFLNMPDEQASYVLVTRDTDGVTHATDISADTFDSLNRLAASAGLHSQAEALQTIRLVVLVEGAHDEKVICHFYGSELARHRVLVVPVRGAQNVNAIFDAPWLSRLGLPQLILFDEVDAATVAARARPSGRNVAARAVWDLLNNWHSQAPKPHVASFPLPDILRALPETCIAKAVEARGGAFPGWEEIDSSYAPGGNTGFKQHLLARSRLPAETDTTELLDQVLDICRGKPHPALADAVKNVLDLARVAVARTPSTPQ
jgi:hypothetical protein